MVVGLTLIVFGFERTNQGPLRQLARTARLQQMRLDDV